MCGISGFVSPNNQLGIEDLHGFNLVQSHRGPDFSDFFYDNFAGLAHQRLKIIDLSSNANQPMLSHCRRFVMIYNGEVYNFKNILTDIKKEDPGFNPVSTSDTEIVLHAFVLWGKEFVNKLNGMFAIAIYDKETKELHLFRDRIGIKPVFWIKYDNCFAFSSELKALSKNKTIRQRLTVNNTAINEFLHLGYIPAPHTIYNEIKKLQPGFAGTYSNNEFTTYQWWNAKEKIESEIVKDEVQALDKLREIVESSVSQCLISDVPFGTFLSGGIDSSLVTAIAQKVSANPINTFSIAFSDSKYNEAKFAKKVAGFLNTNHHEFEVTQNQALEWIPDLMSIYDEPFADSSALPTLLVSKLARSKVTMTLSGDGGDELFMGYGAYTWAQKLNNPLMKIAKKPLSLLLKSGDSRKKRVSHLLDTPSDKVLKSHIFSQEQYFYSRKELKKLLNRNYYSEFEVEETFSNIARKLSTKEQQALFDLLYYLPDDLLVKVDRASMKFGLETRVPLLDYRLVEFALNLDENLKLKNNTSKYLLKKLLYEYVPEEFFQRPKWGFSIPLGSWMKEELFNFANDWLSEDMIKKHGIFEEEYVADLKNKFYKKNQDYLYNRLWQIIVVNMWMEKESK
ncbi:MAG: asparagine synthase (glutamine-hydrolyzing) [Bacteroidetes bacterium]|nr:asparagine synthase (glutamine-hydrolyzing) [Bacteroidota bacterium]